MAEEKKRLPMANRRLWVLVEVGGALLVCMVLAVPLAFPTFHALSYRIKPGMTRAHVEAILGSPNQLLEVRPAPLNEFYRARWIERETEINVVFGVRAGSSDTVLSVVAIERREGDAEWRIRRWLEERLRFLIR